MDRAQFLNLPIPAEMSGRPVDKRGFPVPWFVTRKDEAGFGWDFVNIEGSRFGEAVKREVCWVSGEPLGKFRSFVIGPMCVINRVAGDPPVKKSIATWSVQVCPFLSRPMAHRDKSIDPQLISQQRGVMIERNPGVCAIYTVKRGSYRYGREGLFFLNEPESIEWWTKGRLATAQEVKISIDSGLPTLAEMAVAEGEAAVRQLNKMHEAALKLLPS